MLSVVHRTRYFIQVLFVGADENDQGLQNRAVVNVDSLAYKVSRVLREAWLHVLQTHPSTLPCASVLCYDDAYALRRALHPSATADLHAVLSNPSQYLDATQKGAFHSPMVFQNILIDLASPTYRDSNPSRADTRLLSSLLYSWLPAWTSVKVMCLCRERMQSGSVIRATTANHMFGIPTVTWIW